MAIETDLEEFFSRDIPRVVEDPEKFRKKLNIGMDAFRYLSNAEKLGNFTTTIATGTGAASLAYLGWFASLGTLGQLGLVVGLVSTPAGWVTAAGAGGVVTVIVARKLFRTIKKEAVTELPNFINSPLDVLGASVCDLISPILLKIAHSDGKYSRHEQDRITCYFIDQWGINSGYVSGLLDIGDDAIRDINWNDLSESLIEIERTGDIKYDSMKNEIVRVAEEVMSCDGVIHPDEQSEISRLKEALDKETVIASFKKRIKRRSP